MNLTRNVERGSFATLRKESFAFEDLEKPLSMRKSSGFSRFRKSKSIHLS